MVSGLPQEPAQSAAGESGLSPRKSGFHVALLCELASVLDTASAVPMRKDDKHEIFVCRPLSAPGLIADRPNSAISAVTVAT